MKSLPTSDNRLCAGPAIFYEMLTLAGPGDFFNGELSDPFATPQWLNHDDVAPFLTGRRAQRPVHL
jgi:hypothetical protein